MEGYPVDNCFRLRFQWRDIPSIIVVIEVPMEGYPVNNCFD